SVHHLWALNNIVHGYGQAGINTNESDWVYVLHNTTYDNANVTCDAQGSGIGIVVAKATPNYTLTTMDKTYAPYHQIISWNVSYNNILTQCGTASNPYDTDGNGIIMDTFNGSGVDNVLYPNQTLVANNVTYNNGGRGVEIFRSSYVTVSNNTAYNNNLDPFNSGFPRGEIHEAGGVQNVFTNNVAIAIPAASTADPRCKGASYDIAPAPCPLMANVPLLGGSAAGVTDANNTWTTNVTYGGNPPWGWGPNGNAIISPDTMSCTSNKCNVNPSLVGASSFNFALTAQSPAIGYGAAKPYLATSAVDAGACYHSLTKCP
ncbi:MAG TPA: hypothetical protein VHB27_14675, partial [Rhodopila sp.]|uniref:hypothetical protein n=1 Tax=Rhodopila sp. TaxID=2480087 RepID=UPI002CD7E899